MNSLFYYPYMLLRPLYEKTTFHRKVIDEIEDAYLQRAYRQCRQLTRHHAKTFYMATRFLPLDKQRAIFAIYGICRYLDNLVDEAEDLMQMEKINLPEVHEKLDRFRDELLDSCSGIESENPVLVAFTNVLKTYRIPVRMPLALVEGVKMDLEKTRYHNFNELYDYSYKVASTVGLMTSEVFGYKNEQTLANAVDLGIAMQLTNILRDVGEDLRKGRIYLPQNELKYFGISERQLHDAETDTNFIEFMRFQLARARNYYRSADEGISNLSEDSRLTVYLARENYSRILDKIEQNHYQVFNERAHLNAFEKLASIPRLFYKTRTVGKSVGVLHMQTMFRHPGSPSDSG